MEIGSTITSSSNTCHDPDTILSSILSTIKINNQGYGEYILSNAFVVGVLPLDPQTQGRPTYQKMKDSPPPQK